MGAQEVVERHDRLVEHERPVGGAAHRGALGVGAAGLLEGVLEVAGRAQEAPCGAGREAAVRVGEEHDRRRPTASRTAASRSASASGVGADLDLEPAVALGDELARERDRLARAAAP